MKKTLLYAVLAIMLAGCATPRAPMLGPVETKLRENKLAAMTGFVLAKGPQDSPRTSLHW